MPTIAIYEVFGVKYDQYFNPKKQRTKSYLKSISNTVHIHYIEEVNNQQLSHPRKKLIIT